MKCCKDCKYFFVKPYYEESEYYCCSEPEKRKLSYDRGEEPMCSYGQKEETKGDNK